MSAAHRVADVIALPARTVGSVRAWATDGVDDWGRDEGFVGRLRAISGLRWDVCVGGAEHVPARAGALIVVNARRFALAPLFAALAIGDAVGRPVRFVGRPDVAPLGPLMQRLGALQAIEAELEGALRAAEVVVLGAGRELGNHRTGVVDHRLVGAAVATGVRVLPAATISAPSRRSARVEIGAPARLSRRRRGPLGELELADLVQARIDALLDELGGVSTGTPLDWLPFNPIGDI